MKRWSQDVEGNEDGVMAVDAIVKSNSKVFFHSRCQIIVVMIDIQVSLCHL